LLTIPLLLACCLLVNRHCTPRVMMIAWLCGRACSYSIFARCSSVRVVHSISAGCNTRSFRGSRFKNHHNRSWASPYQFQISNNSASVAACI
jgi:hypothetical protein